ncbi:hypothetical protein ACE6H2_006100 [Prunus campanulata]
MGEAYLVAFLQVLVDKSARREVFKYFGLIKGVDQKLQKWTATLSAIGAVLNKAEERQLITESEPLKLWLDDLRDLAYDLEDVLDKYATKMLERKILQGHHANTARRVLNSVPNGVFNYKMNSEIQKITERLQEISQRKDQLSLNSITGTTSSTKERQNLLPSSSQPDGPVIGREEDKRRVVEFLSKQERGAVNFDSPFRNGAAGSKIIVTTRDAKVSKMMGAGSLVHNLEPMSNDVCFEVFEQHVFRNVNRDIPPNFESLKEKIWAAGDICFRLEDKQNSDHVQLGCFTKARHASYISGSDESGIREIGSLSHLRGTLRLLRLENVIDAEDARRANLKCKERLDELALEWSSDTQETQLGVLDRLEPHIMLKILKIKGYAGLLFSAWIGDHLFSTMVDVSLNNCEKCKMLPPLGQLPSLKRLYIRGMTAVESVGPEFYGERSLPFPVLETLEFSDMHNWKKWLPFAQDQVFPCLKWLSIRNCPQLEGKVPENLDSLETLTIAECKELVISISNFKQIGALDINGCKAVVKTSGVEFELLESLGLSNISEVRFQTGEFTKGLRKVAYLRIGGCEQLTSSLKNEDRVLQHLISLHRLVIEGNSSLLQKLGKEAEELLQLQILTCKLKYLELNKCASLSKVPEGLHHLTALQDLQIVGCSSLVSFPDVGLPPSLEVIRIEKCDSLLYFAKYQIPPNLRRIVTWRCKSLKSLVEKEEDSSSSSSSSHISLEHLYIWECESLTSLSLRAQLFPRALKSLYISNCGELQLITSDGFSHDNTNYCLECISIYSCPNLKSLPEGLCHLTNLRTLNIYDCESLVSIPSLSGEGLPSPTTTAASSLREIYIKKCNKLDMLPDMHNLNCLQELDIDYGEGLDFTSFPPNLTSLTISGIKNCKPLWELLHRLTSLRWLSIDGEDPYFVSFPPDSYREMLLPESLTDVTIGGFPNLKKLSSKAFQFLTSLQSLRLWNCPKLASIPVAGLPISLRQLEIIGCPLLKDKCQPGSKGRYLPKISHIPYVEIRD